MFTYMVDWLLLYHLLPRGTLTLPHDLHHSNLEDTEIAPVGPARRLTSSFDDEINFGQAIAWKHETALCRGGKSL